MPKRRRRSRLFGEKFSMIIYLFLLKLTILFKDNHFAIPLFIVFRSANPDMLSYTAFAHVSSVLLFLKWAILLTINLKLATAVATRN